MYIYIYQKLKLSESVYQYITTYLLYLFLIASLSLSLYSFVDLEYDKFISFLPTISNLSIFPAIHLFIYPSIYLSIWTVYVGYLLTENGNESNNKEPGGFTPDWDIPAGAAFNLFLPLSQILIIRV